MILKAFKETFKLKKNKFKKQSCSLNNSMKYMDLYKYMDLPHLTWFL